MTKKHFDAFCSLRSQKEGEKWFIFRALPEKDRKSVV